MNSTKINEIERDGKTYRFKEMKATFNCDKCDCTVLFFLIQKFVQNGTNATHFLEVIIKTEFIWR